MNYPINYPETIIVKSEGATESERLLTKLCQKSFLSMWSYPNLYRYQGHVYNNGDGKELCDLLVVFDNHIIIFSDKECNFKDTGNIQLDWSRWYKKAIKNSVEQILGAERWISQFPDKIFLDKKCTQKFPLVIPSSGNTIVHRIAVAHGASEKCKEYLGGSGSFVIYPSIVNASHYDPAECLPFSIGKVCIDKYVHVFDDTTLGIVLGNLDTITDFVDYLSQKSKFIESGKLISAAGEEELLSYYLTHMGVDGKHCFPDTNKSKMYVFEEGVWEDFYNDSRKKLQFEANKISYFWDYLIENFTKHIHNGTSQFMSDADLEVQEEIFRFLARENRTKRRFLSESFLGLIKKTPPHMKSSRTILPTCESEPHYIFLLVPESEDKDYEEYRLFRRKLLEMHCVITKANFPDAKIILGIATESGLSPEKSEDYVYLDTQDWSDKEFEQAIQLKEEFKQKRILGKYDISTRTVNEYPMNGESIPKTAYKGKDRNKPCPCGSGRKVKNCCGKLI